jgi:hypothetical protein
MARFGMFKYGHFQKYGAIVSDNLLWAFEVDWDNDGAFDGSGEHTRLKSLSITRGREGMFTSAASGESRFARAQVGNCDLSLDNFDRRYDPWYATSLLYPNVQPGREIRLRVQDGSAGATYDLFRGKIDEIPSTGGRKTALTRITASDGWRLLLDRNSTVALLTDTTADALIDDVLDDVDWLATWGRDLNVGSDTIPYGWVNDQSAFDAIHDLTESEMGLVTIGADGKIYFKSRHTLLLETAALALTEAEVINEPAVTNPWDSIKNKVSVRAYPRQLASLGEIWRLDEIRAVQPGAAVTLWGTFRDQNYNSTIAQDVADPVATTDYTMNTESGGGGTDLTANFTVVATIFSGSVKLVVTNGSAYEGFITLLKIRGKALESLNVSASISENGASQNTYGKRQLTLELPFQQATLVANDLSDWLLSWLTSPLPTVVVEILDRPSLQFAYDLGTLITFTSTYYGIAHSFRIAKIQHDSMESMQVIKTRWTLEPAAAFQAYWQLGIAGYDELGTNTRLAF